MLGREVELGFSFVCPDQFIEDVADSLTKVGLEAPINVTQCSGQKGSSEVEVTGRCRFGQDVTISQRVFDLGQEMGITELIRNTRITFEDLSKRQYLAGGVISTVKHQIAVRSLIQGQEDY